MATAPPSPTGLLNVVCRENLMPVGKSDGRRRRIDPERLTLLLYFTNNNFLLSVFTRNWTRIVAKSKGKRMKSVHLYLKTLINWWQSVGSRYMRFAKCEVRTDHFHRLTADSCSNEIRVASGKSQLSQCNSSKSQILKKTPFLIDINK